MFYTPYSFTWHTYEESRTKEIEQQRRTSRWEEGHCLQCCHFKRRECINQPLLCTGEENLHEHQGYYQHMWRVERSADQSQSKKKWRKCKKKKESLMPGYREERMQEDTVGNVPFGYTACETCNEDARQEVFEFCSISFFKDHCRGQREPWFVAHNLHFT